mmetsp:Transcript_909/g.3753  ORF Transcript_909/g.3753 Transcript_909/m.3753 type:complete len:556 (+) Transcript_909:659-2326(+)
MSGLPPLLVHPRHHRDPHLRLLRLLQHHNVLHPVYAHPVLLRHLSELLILHLLHLLDGQPVHLGHLSLLLLLHEVVLLLHLLHRLAHHLTLRGHDLVQRSLSLGLDLIVSQIFQRIPLLLPRLLAPLAVSFPRTVLKVLLAHLREPELLLHHRSLLQLLARLHLLDRDPVGVRHLLHPLRHLVLGHLLKLLHCHTPRLRLHLEHALLLLLTAALELLHGASVVLSLLRHRGGHRRLGLRLKLLERRGRRALGFVILRRFRGCAGVGQVVQIVVIGNRARSGDPRRPLRRPLDTSGYLRGSAVRMPRPLAVGVRVAAVGGCRARRGGGGGDSSDSRRGPRRRRRRRRDRGNHRRRSRVGRKRVAPAVVVVAGDVPVRVAVAVARVIGGGGRALGDVPGVEDVCAFRVRSGGAVAVFARDAPVGVTVTSSSVSGTVLRPRTRLFGDRTRALQPTRRARVLEPRVRPPRRRSSLSPVNRNLHGVPVYALLVPAPKLDAVVVPPAVEPVEELGAVLRVEVLVPVRVFHFVDGEVGNHRQRHPTREHQAVNRAEALDEVQ